LFFNQADDRLHVGLLGDFYVRHVYISKKELVEFLLLAIFEHL